MNSCGLVRLGYRRADEIYVTDRNSSTADADFVLDECNAVLADGSNGKVTEITFEKGACGTLFEVRVDINLSQYFLPRLNCLSSECTRIQ